MIKIKNHHHGMTIDGNYVPTWFGITFLFFYMLFLLVFYIVRALVKVLIWLCKKISATIRARRGRRHAEHLRGLRTPYNGANDDH